MVCSLYYCSRGAMLYEYSESSAISEDWDLSIHMLDQGLSLQNPWSQMAEKLKIKQSADFKTERISLPFQPKYPGRAPRIVI